jgi:hypothetical protein
MTVSLANLNRFLGRQNVGSAAAPVFSFLDTTTQQLKYTITFPPNQSVNFA